MPQYQLEVYEEADNVFEALLVDGKRRVIKRCGVSQHTEFGTFELPEGGVFAECLEAGTYLWDMVHDPSCEPLLIED
jgi:hypothetical protein